MIVAGSKRGWGVMIRMLGVSVMLAWTGVGCGDSDETNAGSENLVDAAEECACPAPPTAGWTTVVWTSVECMSNPACGTLEQILEPEESCSFFSGPYLRRGCGRIERGRRWISGAHSTQFDAILGCPLAVASGEDVPFGLCKASNVYSYRAGEFLDLTSCPDYEECLNCREATDTGSTPLCQ
jgi:hypothetical protein